MMNSKNILNNLPIAAAFYAAITAAGTQAAIAKNTDPMTLHPNFQICVGEAVSETFPNMVIKVGQDIEVDEYNDGTGFLRPYDKTAIVGKEEGIPVGDSNKASYTLRIHTVRDEEFDKGPVTDLIVKTYEADHRDQELATYKVGLHGSAVDALNNPALRLVDGILNVNEFRNLKNPLEGQMAELTKAIHVCSLQP